MYDESYMILVVCWLNWDPSGYSTYYRVYIGSSMTVRPLAGCRCTCALINWTVLLQHDHIGSSILTSLALHCCLGPSVPSHHSTCPSHLQPVHRAKSCLDLLHLNHMTQCHVSCAMSFIIITCVSFATCLSHFHLHGICCSHTCTCGLITCVSHINTINPPRVVT